jgi:hypothetical protein
MIRCGGSVRGHDVESLLLQIWELQMKQQHIYIPDRYMHGFKILPAGIVMSGHECGYGCGRIFTRLDPNPTSCHPSTHNNVSPVTSSFSIVASLGQRPWWGKLGEVVDAAGATTRMRATRRTLGCGHGLRMEREAEGGRRGGAGMGGAAMFGLLRMRIGKRGEGDQSQTNTRTMRDEAVAREAETLVSTLVETVWR